MPGFLKFFKRRNEFSNESSVYSIMWQKFLKSKLNLFFLFLLIIFTLISVAGYLITPDSTPFANKQHLELTLQKPGSTVQMLLVTKNEETQSAWFLHRMLYGEADKYVSIPVYDWQIRGDFIEAETYTGLTPNSGMIVKYHLVDVFSAIDTVYMIQNINGNYLWRTPKGSVKEMEIQDIVQQVVKKHVIKKKFLLGTDRFGRDVLSQLIIGARVSLAVGFVSVLISLLIGVALGAIAGYFGGRADRFIMWIINVVWAIPSLFLVIAITFALGKGFWQIFFAVGLTLWVEIARLVRGLVMSLRNREYVEAAHALGYSDRRIILNHILPGTMGPVIVVSAANFASAILIESGLSFLGIGIQPPMPSWGTMLRENYGFLIMDYAYLAIIPGAAIMFLVLTFMVLGNGIRDALDVKQIQA